MPTHKEWAEAYDKGHHAKVALLYDDIEEKRASSKVSPEETEEILAIYEKYSLLNFELTERQEKGIRGEHAIAQDENPPFWPFVLVVGVWILCSLLGKGIAGSNLFYVMTAIGFFLLFGGCFLEWWTNTD